MKVEQYNSKLDAIIKLPQFKKWVPPRKNAKNPVLKEEERVTNFLNDLLERKKISSKLHEKLRPTGSQPPRLYGLAKVHKNDIPLRPVLSMPGSAYYNIAKKTADWLSVIPECKINTSLESISSRLNEIKLPEGHEMISFDIVSLYTNVPVNDPQVT